MNGWILTNTGPMQGQVAGNEAEERWHFYKNTPWVIVLKILMGGTTECHILQETAIKVDYYQDLHRLTDLVDYSTRSLTSFQFFHDLVSFFVLPPMGVSS